jgi:hypothetical protein
VIVDAVVNGLRTTNGENRRYWIQFRFPASGRFVEGRGRVNRALWNSLKLGSVVPVRYDPANPDVYELFGRQPEGIPQVVPYLVGLGLPGLAVLMTVPLARQRRLLAEGRPAPGIVTKHTKTRSEHGVHHDVRYEFLMLNGAAHAGKCARAKLVEGQPISVLYEPDNPTDSAPYPLALVRPARY